MGCHGQFYFLSVVGSESFPFIFYLVAILNPVVAPSNKEIYFLLLWVHSNSFSLNLIYLPYWIQLLPLATRILFPVCFGLHLWDLILVLYNLYNLYIYIQLLPLATSNPVIWIWVNLLRYQIWGPLRQSESETTDYSLFAFVSICFIRSLQLLGNWHLLEL